MEENSALCSQLEKEIEDKSEKKLLADNKKKDDQVIASGKVEIQSLNRKVLVLEEKLIDFCKAHEKELADMKSANTVLKDQLCVRQEGIDTLKVQVSSLDKQLKRMRSKEPRVCASENLSDRESYHCT
jgi:hypothetical protein